jgi:outer membrane protein TolC
LFPFGPSFPPIPDMKALFLLLLGAYAVQAETSFVDLPTVMRLAGAKNEEVEHAKLVHRAALLESTQAWQRFWPTLSVGAQYRAHDGQIQDVAGAVFDATKQQYVLGAAVLVDWAPGEIYFSALAAGQRASAAGQAVEKVRLDTVREAVDRYYELLAAEASISVMGEDVAVTSRYAAQLENAVKVGTAFRADLLRVNTQISRIKIQILRGEEQRAVAAARLCETLRLASETALRPAKADLVPIRALKDEPVSALVSRAQTTRPELKGLNALSASLESEEDRARLGPLFPSLQVNYSAGGLSGGRGRSMGGLSGQQDYFVGLGWKVGPGGLLDGTRRKIATTRRESAALQISRARAAIGRDVAESFARSKSAEEQIRLSDEAVVAAEEMSRLAEERQASQVGVVLEFVTAREELTRARLGRMRAVLDFNRAQQDLKYAVGDLSGVER